MRLTRARAVSYTIIAIIALVCAIALLAYLKSIVNCLDKQRMLHSLHQTLFVYTGNHENRYPTKLSLAVPDWKDVDATYLYPVAGRPLEGQPEDYIVLYERLPDDLFGRIAVLYNKGRARTVSRGVFEKTLELDRANKLTAAQIP